MIALDASVLIAHLAKDEGYSAFAREIIREAVGEALLVHPLTLAEVLVGAVRVGREQSLLSDLDAMGVEVSPGGNDQPLRLARLRVSTGLKLPDCCVLDTALTAGARLGTFDAALAAAARRSGIAVSTPT